MMTKITQRANKKFLSVIAQQPVTEFTAVKMELERRRYINQTAWAKHPHKETLHLGLGSKEL